VILLSIITPVFNCRDFISSCIENVASQVVPGTEHIIIDGASTDGTTQIIENAAKKYSHIKWISEPDGGQSTAMNKGVELAQGKILGFLNADDYYQQGALVQICNLFESLPEPSLVVGNCNVWRDDGSLWFVSRPEKINLKNLLLCRFMDAFPMNSSAYFYHKSLHERIGLYEVDEHYAMDIHFILRSVQVSSITYIDQVLGNYRYLQGTKTYEEDKYNRTGPRVNQIINAYIKEQSLCYQFYILSTRVCVKIINVLKLLSPSKGNCR